MAEDIIGRAFGDLTVLSREPNRGTRAIWKCRCSCGATVSVVGKELRKGTRSCGCLRSRTAKRLHTRHGRSETPLYNIWTLMLKRCINPRDRFYASYGGRGIRVCARWRGPTGFENFLADMGERPAGMTLDRRDNDGHYEPGNCRWATRFEQAHNKRNTVLTWMLVHEIRGRHEHGESGVSIARRLGISRSSVSSVVRAKSWMER